MLVDDVGPFPFPELEREDSRLEVFCFCLGLGFVERKRTTGELKKKEWGKREREEMK